MLFFTADEMTSQLGGCYDDVAFSVCRLYSRIIKRFTRSQRYTVRRDDVSRGDFSRHDVIIGDDVSRDDDVIRCEDVVNSSSVLLKKLCGCELAALCRAKCLSVLLRSVRVDPLSCDDVPAWTLRAAHSVLTAFHRRPHRDDEHGDGTCGGDDHGGGTGGSGDGGDHAGNGGTGGGGHGPHRGGVGNESWWSLECCRSTSNHHHSCLARTQTSTRFSSTDNQISHADCSTAASVTASRRDVTTSGRDVTASRRDVTASLSGAGVTASEGSTWLLSAADAADRSSVSGLCDTADSRSVDSVVMPVVYDCQLMMKLLLLLLRALHVITRHVNHQREHHSFLLPAALREAQPAGI